MMQQVNLYQEVESKPTSLILNPYLLACLASIAGLLTFTVLTVYTLAEHQHQLHTLQQQLQAATLEANTLKARLPTPQSNSALEQQLQQTQQLFQGMSNIVALLNDTQSEQITGFSRYFAALANQSDSQVWLSRIEIDATRKRLNLQGSSYEPELIPALLQRLQRSEAFKGRLFSQMQIQQNKENPQQLDFSISSSPAEEGEHGKRP